MGMRLDLQKLYSSGPEAVAVAGKNKIGLKDEWTFWSALKSKGLTEFNPRVLEVVHAKGDVRLFLRVSATIGSNSQYVVGMQQEWAQQPDGWKLIAWRRSPTLAADQPRRLPQPATPNVNLYPQPKEAQRVE